MRDGLILPRRRVLLAGAAVLAGTRAFSQEGRGRPRRVGIVFSTFPDPSKPYVDAFVRGMGEHGYRLDRDYVVDVRYAEGRNDRFPALIAALLAADVDVLLVSANSTAWAAKAATATVPIVMAASLDPEATGLVESLSKPGGNVTGVSVQTASVTAKRLQLLRELLPGASRIVYLTDPKVPGWGRVAREIEDAARAMGFGIAIVEATNEEEIDRSLASIPGRRADALMVGNALLFFIHRRRIVDFCARHRLPASFAISEAVVDGGLVSYAASLRENYARAAYHVARILDGARPGDLPIDQPTRYELYVNKKTADALGIVIPASVLARADAVIQ